MVLGSLLVSTEISVHSVDNVDAYGAVMGVGWKTIVADSGYFTRMDAPPLLKDLHYRHVDGQTGHDFIVISGDCAVQGFGKERVGGFLVLFIVADVVDIGQSQQDQGQLIVISLLLGQHTGGGEVGVCLRVIEDAQTVDVAELVHGGDGVAPWSPRAWRSNGSPRRSVRPPPCPEECRPRCTMPHAPEVPPMASARNSRSRRPKSSPAAG